MHTGVGSSSTIQVQLRDKDSSSSKNVETVYESVLFGNTNTGDTRVGGSLLALTAMQRVESVFVPSQTKPQAY